MGGLFVSTGQLALSGRKTSQNLALCPYSTRVVILPLDEKIE